MEKKRKKLHFSVKVLIGLGLGIVIGIILQPYADFASTFIQPFGTLYLNAVKMLIVPLVFCSLVMGACGLGDVKKFGRIGLKTMGIYLLTTFFAASIGVILGNLTDVGTGLDLKTDVAVEAVETPNFVETLTNIIPSNPIQAMANGDMLQIIVFALFVGAGIVIVGKKAEPVKGFIDGFSDIMYKITDIVMSFTPYAVFALITPVIASNGKEVLLPILIYGMGIRFGVGMNPLEFMKKSWEAIIISFSTCSSSATLPATMQCGKRLGIPLPIRSFTLPLGATVNMDGGAIYQGVTAIFVANLFGVDLSLTEEILIIATAVLASVGTAGVAGASIIMVSVVLTSVGLPMEGVAIVAGVDKLIDMPRTSVNIIGDLMCSAIVARSEGELDAKKTMLEESV